MRRATLALVLLGLVACVSAGDVSRPKHLTGRLSCLLPVSKIQCIRDWRSGFVAGLKLGYEGFSDAQFLQICSNRIQNQTIFDMSTVTGNSLAIDAAQASAPAWYRNVSSAYYLYPRGSPITQVIVLEAPNPWGDKYGTIPAILFGYLSGDTLDFAVCGNALYAQYYLNPGRYPAPPTPVTLKKVFTSSLSEEGELTALGSLDAKCSTRGTGFLGGDIWQSSKFFIKHLSKPCFTKYNNAIQSFVAPPSNPLQRVWGHFHCDPELDDDECKQPCHWSKKDGKKSASYSCAMSGTAIATGKYGAIMFDKDGNKYDWEYSNGHMHQVKSSEEYDEEPYEGESYEEEEEYDH